MKSFMEIAFSQAKLALLKDEVPIGALIANREGEIFAKTRTSSKNCASTWKQPILTPDS